jgi:alkylhydroperoxidase/carboxymuconolactone decarboxylase family protein YurZ
MKDMAPRLTEVDPEFVESLGGLMGLANRREDALDGRVRILIAMALDLASGSAEGTKSMSGAARGFGVTEAQIADVVKVCCAAAALQRMATGSAAFGHEAGAPSGALGVLGQQLDGSDPEFRAAAERVVAAAFTSTSEEGLAARDKYLVALALDAASGSTTGVEEGAARCRQAGASDAEILSVMKMAFVNAALLRLATGRAAFPS